MSTQAITSPVGELQWVFIDGEGREDLSGNKKYSTSLVLDAETAAPFIAKIQEFWEDFKPKGLGAPKSTGYKEVDGDRFSFTFKTNPVYQDGTAKVVDIYNAKANKISLGGKKIGNGSKGSVSGAMGIYNAPGNQAGVTLYLNAVQLVKFVEFAGGASFEAQAEGGFEGLDDSTAEFTEQSTEVEARPKL
jgi:hypothetical protein